MQFRIPRGKRKDIYNAPALLRNSFMVKVKNLNLKTFIVKKGKIHWLQWFCQLLPGKSHGKYWGWFFKKFLHESKGLTAMDVVSKNTKWKRCKQCMVRLEPNWTFNFNTFKLILYAKDPLPFPCGFDGQSEKKWSRKLLCFFFKNFLRWQVWRDQGDTAFSVTLRFRWVPGKETEKGIFMRSIGRKFQFTEANFIFFVSCDTQEEIDEKLAKLTPTVGQISMCGMVFEDNMDCPCQLVTPVLINCWTTRPGKRRGVVMQAMLEKCESSIISCFYESVWWLRFSKQYSRTRTAASKNGGCCCASPEIANHFFWSWRLRSELLRIEALLEVEADFEEEMIRKGFFLCALRYLNEKPWARIQLQGIFKNSAGEIFGIFLKEFKSQRSGRQK